MATKQLVFILGLYVVCLAASGQKNKECVELETGLEYSHGERFYIPSEPCVQYICNNGAYSKNDTECPDPDDSPSGETQCYKLGTKITGNCITKECLDGDEGRIFYITDIKCTDNDGKCHDIGTRFSKKIGNKLREGCTCEKNGEFQVDYRCD